MSIEEIVQAWKSDENALDANAAKNPIGKELTNEELEEIIGGMKCLPIVSCFIHLSQ